jgi:threonyl-tRNA synthetase
MEKYLGTKEIWENAENALREIAQSRDIEYFEAQGEAAMYGPKLDFVAKDSIGREHQVATIQLDFNLPERFDLTCINEKGESERIVMIHAAIMGSIERFSAVLIEHLAGNFPLWVSPTQVRILPVADTHVIFANEVFETLSKHGIRAQIKDSSDSFGKRVRACKVDKIPFYIVIGDKETASKNIKLESRTGEVLEKNVEEITMYLTELVKKRI